MSSPTPRVDLGNTFGALLIGLIIGAVLFGISIAQVFVYFFTHRKVGMTPYVPIVTWLWVLDTLHVAATTHCVYHYLVTDFAKFSELTKIVWSFKLYLLLNLLIVASVHVLYLHRIWKASRGHSRAIPIAVGLVAAISLGISTVTLCSIFQFRVFADTARIKGLTYANFGTITLVDVLIASSLCYFLAISHTGFSSIDCFMVKLMAFVINTGVLTSLCSLTVVITFSAMPKAFIFLSIQFLFPKLYVNSFIALLNAQCYTESVGSWNIGANNVIEFKQIGLEQPHEAPKLCTLPDDDILYPAQPSQTHIHTHRGIVVEVQKLTLSD